MTTVQQAIQAKASAVAEAIKFKGSDAQQAYAAAIAEYHLAMGAMFTANRLEDWNEYMEGALASWKKTYKARGGLNAGEFICQNKPAWMQEKGSPATERIRLAFESRMKAEILDSEFKG